MSETTNSMGNWL